jgi:hypothetical protein
VEKLSQLEALIIIRVQILELSIQLGICARCLYEEIIFEHIIGFINLVDVMKFMKKQGYFDENKDIFIDNQGVYCRSHENSFVNLEYEIIFS